MAAFSKFNQFVEDLAKKVHNLDTDSLKVLLTNTAPSAVNAVKGDLTEIAAGGGYAAGGNAAAFVSGSQTAGVFKLVLTSPATWTGSGAGMGPFRYAVLYNDTPSSPLKPLIGYWDYGASITLLSGETFAVTLDATNGVLTIT